MDQSTLIIIISFGAIGALCLLILIAGTIYRCCSSKRKRTKADNARYWKFDAEVNEERFEDRAAIAMAKAKAKMSRPPKLRRRTEITKDPVLLKEIRYYECDGWSGEAGRMPAPSLWKEVR